MTGTNQPATKQDIQDLHAELKAEIKGVRADGKRTEKALRADMLRLEERLENVEDSQKRMETTLNKISTQLDGFVATVDDLRTDNQVGTHQTRELHLRVDDHEKRIKHLESSGPRA